VGSIESKLCYRGILSTYGYCQSSSSTFSVRLISLFLASPLLRGRIEDLFDPFLPRWFSSSSGAAAALLVAAAPVEAGVILDNQPAVKNFAAPAEKKAPKAPREFKKFGAKGE